jgi:hypothetical protein
MNKSLKEEGRQLDQIIRRENSSKRQFRPVAKNGTSKNMTSVPPCGP